ncbi:MAG: hypothetical protein Q9181_008004 [Wetmoreana brouardii]
MVIHSIEGGCPAKAAGNLPENANGDGAAKFQYSIPQGINPGEYTLAWTWFNKIGNREMYMNCAPVTVTGGSKKRDTHCANATAEYGSDEAFDKRDTSFPEMFKANIMPDCKTKDSTDLQFPNPGASVEKAGDAKDLAPPVGCGAASSGSSNGGSAAAPAAGASGSTPSAAPGSGSGTGSGTISIAAGAASPAVTSVVAIPPPGASGASMATAAASVASAAQSVASAAASVVSGAGQAAPAPTGSASSSGSANTSSGSSSGSSASGSSDSGSSSSSGSAAPAAAAPGSMPCTSVGQTVCSADGMKFGTCDSNKMAAMMAVAQGTKCMNAQIVHAKRSAKFAKAYKA